MKCIGCGTSSEFDHVVVRLVDREDLGTLCLDCQAQASELFKESDKNESEHGCRMCPRSSSYALPQWDIIAQDKEGADELLWLEYDISESTIRLCDQHIDSLSNRPDILSEDEISASFRSD